MLLKKIVAGTLVGTAIFYSVFLVWGLVFTKGPINTSTNSGSGSGSTASGQQAVGGAQGVGSDTVNSEGSTSSGSGGGSGGTNSSGTSGSAPTGVPGSGSSSSGGTTSGTAAPAGSKVAPILTLSTNKTSVTSGTSATIGWSINAATAPVSCQASGGWSGTKATSGSQVVTPASTTTYTMVCTNSVGSSTKSVTVSVTAAPAPSYCGGNANCYSLGQIQGHNTSGNCWGYTNKKTSNGFQAVYSLTTLVGAGHGQKGINSGNFFSKCGADITSCLNGTGGCSSSKNHSSGDLGSYSQSLVGYYDPAKP